MTVRSLSNSAGCINCENLFWIVSYTYIARFRIGWAIYVHRGMKDDYNDHADYPMILEVLTTLLRSLYKVHEI